MIGRRAPVALGLIFVLSGVVTLVAWGLASAPSSAPDDDFHLVSIWCAEGIDAKKCAADPNGDPTVRMIPTKVVHAACFHYDLAVSGNCQDGLPEPIRPDVVTAHGNWNGLYPPVFYEVMGNLVQPDDLEESVLRIRALNAAVVLVLVIALGALVPRRLRSVAVAPLILISVPLGLSLFVSTNPSSWAIASAATVWLAFYASFEVAAARRWALLAVALVAVIVGAGARGDACAFSVLGIIVALSLRYREVHRHLAILATALVGVGVSGYFLSNADQSGFISGGLPADSLGLPWWHLLVVNIENLPTVLFGGFGYGPMGGGGWFDTPYPTVVLLGLLAWFGVVFAALSDGTLLNRLVVALVGLALVSYPLIILGRTGVMAGAVFQPRYLMPLLVMFTGVTLLAAVSRPGRRLGRVQLVVAVACLATANTVALFTNLRRYVTGLDVGGFNLDRDKEWWWDLPVSATFVWIAGSLAFALLAYLALREYAEEVPPAADPDPAEGPKGERAAIPGRPAATAA